MSCASVLVVGQTPGGADAFEGMLRRGDVAVLTAGSCHDALELARQSDVELAIIGTQLAEMDGFELAERMRSDDRNRHLPILFVGDGSYERPRTSRGWGDGVVDFLSHPVDEEALLEKVDVLVTLERQRRQLRSAVEQAQAARVETEQLFRLAQATGACSTPEEIFAPALDAVQRLAGAERSSILLFDEEGRMRFRAWRGLSDAYRGAVDGHSPWSPDAVDPEPILVSDVEEDETLAPYRAVFAAEEIRALAFIPLVARHRLLGKFMLYWRTPHAFSAHERELVRTVAAHVADALERARMQHDERKARQGLTRLQRVTASLNETLTREGIGKVCLPVVCEAVGGSVGALYVTSADGTWLEAVHVVGIPSLAAAYRRFPVSEPVPPADAVRSLRTVVYETLEAYQTAYPHLAADYSTTAGSRAAIPLVTGGRAIGALGIGFPTWRALSAEDHEFLSAVAGQCAQALERAHLHEAERSARAAAQAAERRAAFLADASAELSRSLDPQATLRRIAQLAVPAVADWCAVALATGEVLRTGPSPLDSEVSDELLAAAARDAGHLAVLRELASRSAMVVPIAAAGGTLGVIVFVTAETPRPYGQQDLSMAEELGRRAGLAIENARLFTEERRARADAEAAQQRRAAIELVSEAALAHLDTETLLAEMLGRVRAVFRCDVATLLLRDAKRGRLVVRACDGLPRQTWEGVALPAASGFAGTIAAERRPRVLEGGATAELMWPVLRERLRALAGVPLVLGEDVLGVLHVGSDAPRVFGDDDIALLEMVAARIASALDRAAAYESLRRAEERLHVALEAGRMGVWEWQAEAQRMSWSPTLEAIHGLPAGSFEGTLQAYRDRLHPEDRERVLRAMRESFEMGADFHAEYRVRRPGGDLRWLSTHGQVIADGDGRPAGLTGICRDVTEEKLLDAARETAIAELTRNAKLHEVFTGILGHDLRNPLGAILMGSHFAISQNEDQRLVKPLARILRSAERMARMIDQLLDFTRVRLGGGIPVDPRQADLLPVLRQVVEELDDAHPDAVLRFEHAGDSAGSWDPDRLAQVFSNLVGNALQHGTGHDVQVRLDGSAEEALLVEVRNAGRIPEELLPNLFEPLSGRSVKTGSPQGFGLGLFISHEIVQAHGGRLDVRSDGENGTVFQVRLPRARGRG